MLQARLGDCLLMECYRDPDPPWRLLVDGGPPDTWPLLQQRLAQLDPAQRIDVALVTHIDSDHIGGLISMAQSEWAARVDDFWFNGLPHLPERGSTEKRSVPQGESLTAALVGDGSTKLLPWNKAFNGGAIDTGEEQGFLEVPIANGPSVTVLSPTTKRLQILRAKWQEAIITARRGIDTTTPVPDLPASLNDLEALAATKTAKDKSPSNGSSIALLIEHRGASVLLGADAFGVVLGAGLTGLANARGLTHIAVDAFKLPHHASQGNVLEALLRIAPARHYLISSNGDTYHHPDDPALARTVLTAPTEPTLWFNYDTTRTRRWGDPTLLDTYHYHTRFPSPGATSVVLDLPDTT